MDELHVTKGPADLESLDNKLADALKAPGYLKGELRRDIIRRDEKLWDIDDWLSGRQILWLYYKSVNVDPVYGDVYHTEKFLHLEIHGDDDRALRRYIEKWDDYVLRVPAEHMPSGPMLELKFRAQVSRCREFNKEWLSHFDRFECRYLQTKTTYEQVREQVDRYLAKILLDKKQKAWIPQDHSANTFAPSEIQRVREKGDCRAWMRGGRCSYGDKCQFTHDPMKAGINKGRKGNRDKTKQSGDRGRDRQRRPFKMSSRPKGSQRNSSQTSRWSSSSRSRDSRSRDTRGSSSHRRSSSGGS